MAVKAKKKKRVTKKKVVSSIEDRKITDIDDLVAGLFYYVMTNQKKWEIRQYRPSSKAFTVYGMPNIHTESALSNGIVPVPLTP